MRLCQAFVVADSSTSTGLKWAAVASTSGPAFRAYRTTSNQSFTNETLTKVQFNAEQFDTAGNFDPTTNYRFTPTTAGYYQLNWNVTASGVDQTASSGYAALYFNGSLEAFGSNGARNTGFNYTISAGSVLKYFNGSTDYAEIYIYTHNSTNPAVFAGIDYSSFSGVWIRS